MNCAWSLEGLQAKGPCPERPSSCRTAGARFCPETQSVDEGRASRRIDEARPANGPLALQLLAPLDASTHKVIRTSQIFSRSHIICTMRKKITPTEAAAIGVRLRAARLRCGKSISE